jgi:hypothetical protein
MAVGDVTTEISLKGRTDEAGEDAHAPSKKGEESGRKLTTPPYMRFFLNSAECDACKFFILAYLTSAQKRKHLEQ